MDPKALAALWEVAGLNGQRATPGSCLEARDGAACEAQGRQDPIEKRLVPEWRDQGDMRPVELALEHVALTRQRRKAAEAPTQTA